MINFTKRLTDEQRERYRKRKEDEKRRTVGKITAHDEAGNTFEKKVILTEELDIIDFGWPIRYYLEDTYARIKRAMNDGQPCERFVIDACGLNHKGHEVFLKIDDAYEIFEKAIALKKELQNDHQRVQQIEKS